MSTFQLNVMNRESPPEKSQSVLGEHKTAIREAYRTLFPVPCRGCHVEFFATVLHRNGHHLPRQSVARLPHRSIAVERADRSSRTNNTDSIDPSLHNLRYLSSAVLLIGGFTKWTRSKPFRRFAARIHLNVVGAQKLQYPEKLIGGVLNNVCH